MRRNRLIMGTGVSLDIPAAANETVFDEVFELLQAIDAQFSPYKKDSELSKYQRGEIEDHDLSADMKQIKKECQKYQKLTDGYFSACFAGEFNPTGYVKGWAIKRAGDLLAQKGFKTFCIGVGGDILASSDGKKQWQIGLQNPTDKQKILNKLSIYNGAAATSGNYERGEHIINPRTGQPATELLSVTVTGPDIITADVLATAVFAMGPHTGSEFMKKQKDYQASIALKTG